MSEAIELLSSTYLIEKEFVDFLIEDKLKYINKKYKSFYNLVIDEVNNKKEFDSLLFIIESYIDYKKQESNETIINH